MNHKLKSRFPGEMSVTSDLQMTPPLWQKLTMNWRDSWWKWKRSVKKPAWNSMLKNSDHGIWPYHFMTNRWDNSGNRELIFLDSKITADSDSAMTLKDACSLEENLWQSWQHIKKQRCYFAYKGPSSQCYGFSSSYAYESWAIKMQSAKELLLLDYGVGEDSWDSLRLQGDPPSQF